MSCARVPTLVALLAFSAVLLAACGDGADRAELPDADALGSLVLPDLEGKHVPLTAWRGKVVVLNVWAAWCAPCRRELPSLDRLAREIDSSRVAVVGIAVDEDVLVVRELARRAGISYTVLLDPGRAATAVALPVRTIPETYLIAPDGRVRERIRGVVDFDDLPAWRARLARAQVLR